MLLGLRWIIRNARPPEAPAEPGRKRTLLAGPTLGRPGAPTLSHMVVQAELYASAPGFDATLPHTLGTQVAGLTEIRCPVLVLWGTKDDGAAPRQGRRFERLIPDCELRYLKGLGHVPMSDDPKLLSEAIADFAARPSSSPARRAAARV